MEQRGWWLYSVDGLLCVQCPRNIPPGKWSSECSICSENQRTDCRLDRDDHFCRESQLVVSPDRCLDGAGLSGIFHLGGCLFQRVCAISQKLEVPAQVWSVSRGGVSDSL